MTEDQFYIWQLRDVLKDVLAVSKPQWTFKGDVWDSRVARARYLLDYGPLHPYKDPETSPSRTNLQQSGE
jgi:hypothetical protein